VIIALPSLSQTFSLPTELKESRPSAKYWAGSGQTNFEISEIYIRVARLFAPGAHSLKHCCYALDCSFCRVLLLPSRIALSSLSCIVSFVSLRDLALFASEFLTITRIISSSFRVSFRLRFAYRQTPINKLLGSSCIVPILRFKIVDSLLDIIHKQ